MPDASQNPLNYWSVSRPRTVWLRPRITIALVAVLAYVAAWYIKLNVPPNHYTAGENAPWNYSGRIGADNAIELIHAAVRQFVKETGTIPGDLNVLKSRLPHPRSQRPVTPALMLPHVMIVWLKPGSAYQQNLVKEGQYVVMVYILGAGPMHFNRTLLEGVDDEYGSHSCDDEEIVALFGQDVLRQLQMNAYQLPPPP